MPTPDSTTTLPTERIAGSQADTDGHYDAVRFNAMKHGILSRHAVLPHEDADDYATLVAALVHEHQPAGITEVHLVEELATIIWRKRRVLLAEGATLNEGIRSAIGHGQSIIRSALPFANVTADHETDLGELLSLSPAQATERHTAATTILESLQVIAALLEKNSTKAYEKAIKMLDADSRDSWQVTIEEEEVDANAEGLAGFIDEALVPYFTNIAEETKNYAAIMAQTLGEGIRPFQLEKLGRYEVHLDRKFQRTLAMLVKLKQLRGAGGDQE